jgi:cbb3-type cytochrome oxidase maturation protein
MSGDDDHRNVDAAVLYTAQEIDPRDNPERTPRRRSKTVNVLVYLVPMALGLGLLGLFAFLWALRSGQYSDVDGAAQRVLSDDDLKE